MRTAAGWSQMIGRRKEPGGMTASGGGGVQSQLVMSAARAFPGKCLSAQHKSGHARGVICGIYAYMCDIVVYGALAVAILGR